MPAADAWCYVYMSMEEVLAKLNDYVLLLSEAQEKDNYANNRPMFTKRLAAAAEMYALLHKNHEVTAIDALVQQEIRAHGWSFIEGPYGENIASAWVAFTKATGIDQ